MRRRNTSLTRRALAAFIALVTYLTVGTPYAVRAQYGQWELDDRVAEDFVDGVDAEGARRLAEGVLDGQERRDALDEYENLADPSMPDYLPAGEDLDPAAFEATQRGTDDGAAAAAPDFRPVTRSLTGSEGASAVTPQAISLPTAEGSIEGMGESFSPVLSSGTGTFSVPIAVPAGRAGVQPSLALAYSTGGGNGPVGFGWGLGAPFIARQTDRGLARYVDAPGWHPEEDRFIYNGGQELVPVDSGAMASVDGYGAGALPSDVGADWQQYRARVEGGFMRFFRSPDGARWVVQSKDGTRFDFGLLSVGDGPTDMIVASAHALDAEYDDGSGRIARWCLTRMSDAHGSVVYYRYLTDGGARYLQDIHYLSPATCGGAGVDAARNCTSPLADYGARVRLVYESREDVFSSYAHGWRVETGLRVKRIEITAADTSVGGRYLVRRYHLGYDAGVYHSLLTSVRVEGRPDVLDATAQVRVGRAEAVSEDALSDALVGLVLPPMTFGYSVQPTNAGTVPGFGGIDDTVLTVIDSPPHSVNEARADLMDVNSDGLPDLVVTDPARYRTVDGAPAVGVFFNGFYGAGARPAGAGATFSGAIALAIPSGKSGVMNLGNLNVVPMDIDGDGRGDLLHMPRVATYGWFSPTRAANDEVSPADQGWRFSYGEVNLPRGVTDPRIDLTRDAPRIKVLDVNNDHLIDVVRTSGTVMQTWLNLGWLPGGDGRFGSFRWNGATGAAGASWDLSPEPLESCLLHDGVPVDFADPEVRIADMNGDGIQDIVKIRRGRVVWWPGRGEGIWGDGPATCGRGEGAGRELRMTTPPAELNVELDGVYLSDVNEDGAADVVQVRYDSVDVWFNRGGTSFTARLIARRTPYAPSYAPRIRFADIDGSGTTDLIYGNAGSWQYLDLMGGVQPRVLTSVDNGLGAVTSLGYESSVVDYMRDLEAADGCAGTGCERFTWSFVEADGCPAALTSDGSPNCYLSGGSPVVSTVVRSVATTDRFDEVGREETVTRTEYAYHDGYYEGIEQEYRGFGAADAIAVGEATFHPSSHTRTYFYQGRRPGSIARDRLADNPRECLKARAYLTDTWDPYDDSYLSSTHSSYVARRLATGLDGRAIYYAYVSQSDEARYGNDSPVWMPGSGTLADLPTVAWEGVPAGGGAVVPEGADGPQSLALRGGLWAHLRSTTDSVDNVGNVLRQTAHGRIADSAGGGADPLIQSHTTPTLCNGAGWIWRTESGYVSDGGSLHLGETSNSYALETCDLAASSQPVTLPPGTPSYDFSGDGTAAGLMLGAQTLQQSTTYDPWGNATATCAGADISGGGGATACLRYAEVDYDAGYGQLPTTERIAVDKSSAPFGFLATTATWDRGLGVLLSAVDPNGEVTEVGYDGLGRLTHVTSPDLVCGAYGLKPTQRFRYELVPGGRPVSVIHSDADTYCPILDYNSIRTKSYVDGLGRARVTVTRGDTGTDWEQAGSHLLSSRGTVAQVWQPARASWPADGPTPEEALGLPLVPVTINLYDAFGRQVQFIDVDMEPTSTSYGALATHVWDPLDQAGAQFAGTYSTTRTDGHGRGVDQVLRPTAGGATYRLYSTYRTDGAVTSITRAEAASDAIGATVVAGHSSSRQFYYDTAGRRLGSTDPDTDSPTGSAGSDTWRYLYNQASDLVAVRDPRGCGQNFYYDHGGRLLGEDYVGCAEAQITGDTEVETVPGAAIALGEIGGAGHTVDVRYYFDTDPPWASSMGTKPVSLDVGRMTGVADRAQRTLLAYNARGGVAWQGRQAALIPLENSAPLATLTGASPAVVTGEDITPGSVAYDEAHTYEQSFTYDHQGRPSRATYPSDPDYFYDPDLDGVSEAAPAVEGMVSYTRRGLVYATRMRIDGGPWNNIISAARYDADRQPNRFVWGLQSANSIRQNILYDDRRRPRFIGSARNRSPGTMSGELGYVAAMSYRSYYWDAANNLVGTREIVGTHRRPGSRVADVDIAHDALYRVTESTYEYHDGSTWGPDIATDWRDERTRVNADTSTHESVGPMRERPAPMVSTMPPNRVAQLDWSYDWLANMTSWTDDAASFYERSIGAIENGHDAGLRPSALYLSHNVGGAAADGGGWLEVDYGVSGNVETMTVHGQCMDAPGESCEVNGAGLTAQLAELRTECICTSEQHYQYRWDELNRMSEARRYDGDGSGTWELAVRHRYRYDSGNQRMVKHVLSYTSAGALELERVGLTVYPGDFARKGLRIDLVTDSYEPHGGVLTETQYLISGARMVWKKPPAGSMGGYVLENDARLTYAITDLIQSTNSVVDLWSGELLELSTYYPNGAQETHWTQDGVSVEVEPLGFTGKEADSEVGVTYFGERYLVERIGRWASPDPLHVHAVGGGEALNSYHYVGGNLLQARDPIGLSDMCAKDPSAPGCRPTIGIFVAAPVPAPAAAAGAAASQGIIATAVSALAAIAAAVATQIDLPADSPPIPIDAPGQVDDAPRVDPRPPGGARRGDPPNGEPPRVDPQIGWGVALYVATLIMDQEIGGAGVDEVETADASAASEGQLRDAQGRFASDPNNPPSPYSFNDSQRRSAWRRLAGDPNSILTDVQRAQVKERGWRGPQRLDDDGEVETMELSHEPTPLREGGTEVVPRWPADHARVDAHRHLKKNR